jgi:hypothetical protein
VNGDIQSSPETVPLRSRRRASVEFLGPHALLVVLLATAIAAAACAWPANAMQQDPGRITTTASIRSEGLLRAIGPGKWQVGQFSVLLDGTTIVIQKRGRAELGAWVIVWGQQSDSGEIRAELIQVDRPASRSGPLTQFSGVLRKKTDTWWMVEQTLIEISDDTMISGNPAIGALIWVVATQQGDTLRAVAAEVLASDPEIPLFEFEGSIASLTTGMWQVDNQKVFIDKYTQIVGEPKIGKIAEVRASQQANGRLLARLIRIVDPSAEASLSAMVVDIVSETDDTERWEVVVFPKSAWADPTLATLHVSVNTYVDESRATAQTGIWADVRGVYLGSEEYQADVIRLERPLPVSITGEVLPAPTTSAASGWGQINGQPVWLGSVEPGMASAQAVLDGNMSVTGVRLGNGVIWAKQIRSVEH